MNNNNDLQKRAVRLVSTAIASEVDGRDNLVAGVVEDLNAEVNDEECDSHPYHELARFLLIIGNCAGVQPETKKKYLQTFVEFETRRLKKKMDSEKAPSVEKEVVEKEVVEKEVVVQQEKPAEEEEEDNPPRHQSSSPGEDDCSLSPNLLETPPAGEDFLDSPASPAVVTDSKSRYSSIRLNLKRPSPNENSKRKWIKKIKF
jgi:hypothetical protein